MSESLTDTSYNRRESSNDCDSEGSRTECTSDDQRHDNTRYMVILLFNRVCNFQCSFVKVPNTKHAPISFGIQKNVF